MDALRWERKRAVSVEAVSGCSSIVLARAACELLTVVVWVEASIEASRSASPVGSSSVLAVEVNSWLGSCAGFFIEFFDSIQEVGGRTTGLDLARRDVLGDIVRVLEHYDIFLHVWVVDGDEHGITSDVLSCSQTLVLMSPLRMVGWNAGWVSWSNLNTNSVVLSSIVLHQDRLGVVLFSFYEVNPLREVNSDE